MCLDGTAARKVRLMDIVLIAGLWLPRSIWTDVANELESHGHRPLPVALPGVDDSSTNATLADQLEAALAAVDAASRPMVVGHSAACTLDDSSERTVLISPGAFTTFAGSS